MFGNAPAQTRPPPCAPPPFPQPLPCLGFGGIPLPAPVGARGALPLQPCPWHPCHCPTEPFPAPCGRTSLPSAVPQRHSTCCQQAGDTSPCQICSTPRISLPAKLIPTRAYSRRKSGRSRSETPVTDNFVFSYLEKEVSNVVLPSVATEE